MIKMTIEQALKILNKAEIQVLNIHPDNQIEFDTAFLMAVNALKEQQENKND